MVVFLDFIYIILTCVLAYVCISFCVGEDLDFKILNKKEPRCKKCGQRDWQIKFFNTEGLCRDCDERRYYKKNGWL